MRYAALILILAACSKATPQQIDWDAVDNSITASGVAISDYDHSRK